MGIAQSKWEPYHNRLAEYIFYGQSFEAIYGQPVLLVSKPSEVNDLRDFLHTGKRYPTFERSPKDQRHGQREKRATQC